MPGRSDGLAVRSWIRVSCSLSTRIGGCEPPARFVVVVAARLEGFEFGEDVARVFEVPEVVLIVARTPEEEPALGRQQLLRDPRIFDDLSVFDAGRLHNIALLITRQTVAGRDLARNELRGGDDGPYGFQQLLELLRADLVVTAIIVAVLNVLDEPAVDVVGLRQYVSSSEMNSMRSGSIAPTGWPPMVRTTRCFWSSELLMSFRMYVRLERFISSPIRPGWELKRTPASLVGPCWPSVYGCMG